MRRLATLAALTLAAYAPFAAALDQTAAAAVPKGAYEIDQVHTHVGQTIRGAIETHSAVAGESTDRLSTNRHHAFIIMAEGLDSRIAFDRLIAKNE